MSRGRRPCSPSKAHAPSAATSHPPNTDSVQPRIRIPNFFSPPSLPKSTTSNSEPIKPLPPYARLKPRIGIPSPTKALRAAGGLSNFWKGQLQCPASPPDNEPRSPAKTAPNPVAPSPNKASGAPPATPSNPANTPAKFSISSSPPTPSPPTKKSPVSTAFSRTSSPSTGPPTSPPNPSSPTSPPLAG